jgi:LCP family protein required for cell wall assembly
MKQRRRPSPVWAITALTAAVMACSFQDTGPALMPASATITETETVTLSPSITVSPTVTLTPTATKTLVPTEIPTSTITPTQVLPVARFPETTVPILRDMPYPAGQVRVMVVIVDNSTPNTPRADSIHLIALNTKNDTASWLSVPSSLYVNIPNVGMERLYSAMLFGGPGKLLDALQYNLGVRADRFIAVDMDHLGQLIESLGPIDVPVAVPLTSACGLPFAVNGTCTAVPGIMEMDKGLTLWYLRDRSGGENDRMRRSQEVLLGFFNRLMDTQAPARLEELRPLFQSNLETDLTTEDLDNLSPISVAVYSNRQVRRAAFTDREAVPYTLPDGQNVLLLDQLSAWNLIQGAFFQP